MTKHQQPPFWITLSSLASMLSTYSWGPFTASFALDNFKTVQGKTTKLSAFS